MNRNIRIARQLIRIAKMLIKAGYDSNAVFTEETFAEMTDSDFYTNYIEDNIDNYSEFEEYYETYTDVIREYADRLVEEDDYDTAEAAEKAVMDFGENCGYAVEGKMPPKDTIVPEYAEAMEEIIDSL